MSEQYKKISPTDEQLLRMKLDSALKFADSIGAVVTVSQIPLKPLASGNYETRVEIRPKRNCK